MTSKFVQFYCNGKPIFGTLGVEISPTTKVALPVPLFIWLKADNYANGSSICNAHRIESTGEVWSWELIRRKPKFQIGDHIQYISGIDNHCRVVTKNDIWIGNTEYIHYTVYNLDDTTHESNILCEVSMLEIDNRQFVNNKLFVPKFKKGQLVRFTDKYLDGMNRDKYYRVITADSYINSEGTEVVEYQLFYDKDNHTKLCKLVSELEADDRIFIDYKLWTPKFRVGDQITLVEIPTNLHRVVTKDSYIQNGIEYVEYDGYSIGSDNSVKDKFPASGMTIDNRVFYNHKLWTPKFKKGQKVCHKERKDNYERKAVSDSFLQDGIEYVETQIINSTLVGGNKVCDMELDNRTFHNGKVWEPKFKKGDRLRSLCNDKYIATSDSYLYDLYKNGKLVELVMVNRDGWVGQNVAQFTKEEFVPKIKKGQKLYCGTAESIAMSDSYLVDGNEYVDTSGQTLAVKYYKQDISQYKLTPPFFPKIKKGQIVCTNDGMLQQAVEDSKMVPDHTYPTVNVEAVQLVRFSKNLSQSTSKPKYRYFKVSELSHIVTLQDVPQS